MKVIFLLGTLMFLSACQENYIQDVGGGTIEVSSPILSGNKTNSSTVTRD